MRTLGSYLIQKRQTGIQLRLTGIRGFLTLAVAFACSASFSQTKFQKTIGGTVSEHLWGSCRTADSGYVFAGIGTSFGPGGMYLVKTDDNADTLWTRNIGGGQGDI